MAKLSGYRRIMKGDYAEEYRPFIEQLAVSVNNGFDTLFTALNGKLNFYDNIASTIVEIKVAVDSNGKPIQKAQFKLSNNQTNVEGILVLKITGADDPTLLAESGLAISYTLQNNVVTINNIKGLKSQNFYYIKLLAIS